MNKNNISKTYLLGVMSAIALGVASCSSNNTAEKPQTVENVTPNISTPSPAQTTAPNISINESPLETQPQGSATPNTVVESPDPNQIATSPASGATTNVTLYKMDAQCDKQIPQTVAVPSDEPVENIVGKVIEQQDSADFNVAGYRVNIDNGVATVDLRIAPDSPRQLVSLSSCEQSALFGSLRKTLTSNPQWNIKDVRFTEKGQQIIL